MEKYYDVEIVTQNIDDLHERVGSTQVTHLHGELTKLRSSSDENAIVQIEGWEQMLDARHSDGSLLRPFVVFFGEDVPIYNQAVGIVRSVDILVILVIVGTSLIVYPAASLVLHARKDVPIYLVDPLTPSLAWIRNKVVHIKKNSVDSKNLFKFFSEILL